MSSPMVSTRVTATGRVPVGAIVRSQGPAASFNISIQPDVAGSFAGSAQLERSWDGGATWEAVTFPDGTAVSWTKPVSTSWSESERDVQYAINVTALTSGAMNIRVSQ